MTTEPFIKLSGIHYSPEPGRDVLRGVDLEVFPTERVAFIGPNGAGKTTLFHVITGLLTPHAGSVWAFGRPRDKETDFKEVRARAGLLFQDSDDQLFSPTVMEDVAFGPLNLGKTPKQAADIAAATLDRLGLSGFEERITYRLSGGEKRLVALATVLAMEPDVLLLDEPTNGLDSHVERRLIRILQELPQAMVIISHDREFLGQLATRTVKLRSGKIGDAAEVPGGCTKKRA